MKLICLLLIHFLNFHSFGQNKNLCGKILDSKTNQPIFGAKIVVKINDRILVGTRTDFDGNYQFQNVNFSIDSVKLSIDADCFQSNQIVKLTFINDTTLIDYKLISVNCSNIVEQHCKFNSDSCDIYAMKNVMDNNRYKIKKKNETRSEPEKVFYTLIESYPDCCGSKTQYCATHKYQY